MSPKRILVIDDEPGICDLFCAALEDRYLVQTAGSGREGVQAFQKDPPALVLLDIQMPDMTGIEVLQKIRKFDSNVPVLMITAYGTVRTAKEAMSLGASDYLLKPLNIENIRSQIQKILEIHELEKGVSTLRQQRQAQKEEEGEEGSV